MSFLDPIIIIKTVGALGVFAAVFAETGLFFGFFFPGDSLLFAAGLMASRGYLDPALMFFGIFLASIFGNLAGYYFGRHIGHRIFVKENSLFFNKKYIEDARIFFEKHGKKAVILARFMPIVRTYVPIFAGVGQMNNSLFLFHSIIGGFIWTAGLVGFGYFLGNIAPDADKYVLPIVIAIIIISFLPAVFGKFAKGKKAV